MGGFDRDRGPALTARGDEVTVGDSDRRCGPAGRPALDPTRPRRGASGSDELLATPRPQRLRRRLAGSRGHPSRAGRVRPRRVLRPGLRPRPGSALAHGVRPPPGLGTLGGARGRGRRAAGRAGPAPRPRSERPPRLRDRGRRDARDARRVRRRRQRLPRHDHDVADRAPAPRPPPRALGAVGQPRRLQGPSRGDGAVADEALARPSRAAPRLAAGLLPVSRHLPVADADHSARRRVPGAGARRPRRR